MYIWYQLISWNPKVFSMPFRNGHQDGPTSSSLDIKARSIKLSNCTTCYPGARFWFIKMIQDMFFYWWTGGFQEMFTHQNRQENSKNECAYDTPKLIKSSMFIVERYFHCWKIAMAKHWWQISTLLCPNSKSIWLLISPVSRHNEFIPL